MCERANSAHSIICCNNIVAGLRRFAFTESATGGKRRKGEREKRRLRDSPVVRRSSISHRFVAPPTCVCVRARAPRGAAPRKRAAWSGRRERRGVAERAGKGKIREGSSGKAKAKRKNEAHISGPVYDADDDDDGDAEDTHTRTQNEGFSYGVTAALQGSRSATASKGREPLEKNGTAEPTLSPALCYIICS